SLYGKGVADSFADGAKTEDLTVIGRAHWNAYQSNYRDLMNKIKDSGADGVYIGGVLSRNGGQLIRDKLKFLGDNKKVKLLVSDGFVGAAFFPKDKRKVDGAYGTRPAEDVAATNAATQVLLDAISRSEGSRKDVINRLFSTRCGDTDVGPMSFDRRGDPRAAVEKVKL